MKKIFQFLLLNFISSCGIISMENMKDLVDEVENIKKQILNNEEKNSSYDTPKKSTDSIINPNYSAPPKLNTLNIDKKSIPELKSLNFQNNTQYDISSERIALFRGIHYVTNLFNDRAIIKNTEVNDLNTFLVSSAACKLTGISFLSDSPSNEEFTAGLLIHKILYKFKTNHQDLYYKFHQTYTNNHIKFHSLLEDPSKDKKLLCKEAFTKYREIFKKKTKEKYPDTWNEAIKRNPFVSFSCQANHALKYGLGQKSFTGGDSVKLLPNYEKNGKPKNKYLGKIYIAIFSPNDIERLNPTFVIDKHAKNKVKIHTHNQNNILSENEVSFLGYLPREFIKYSSILEIPDLTPDEKSNYADINNNFSKANGKSVEIIKNSSETFKSKANNLIEALGFTRTYPNVFENDYTDIPEDTEKIRVAQWLHSINNSQTIIASTPMKAVGSATKESIIILEKCLKIQSFELKENWTNYLKVISMSFCKLKDSGISFYNIIKNKKIQLEELYLKKCDLRENDTLHIAKSVSDNRYLKYLVLDYNIVGNSSDEYVNSLKKNTTLTHLSLYQTKISKFQNFADLFPFGGYEKSLNKTLTVLNLDFLGEESIYKTIERGLYRNLLKGD